MKYLYYDNDEILKMITDKKLDKSGNLSYIKKELTEQEELDIADITKDKKIVNNKLVIR